VGEWEGEQRWVQIPLGLFLLYIMQFFSGTASDDIAAAIRTYKQGHPYKCDRLGYVNIGIGKV